jgi:hypothetical protein
VQHVDKRGEGLREKRERVNEFDSSIHCNGFELLRVQWNGVKLPHTLCAKFIQTSNEAVTVVLLEVVSEASESVRFPSLEVALIVGNA